ncbi:MAG: hypothetical protein IJ523_03300 [Succinivibrionaceae bacterium]|nr:hypothetical protein [Succinivibrionaceae bacterium]
MAKEDVEDWESLDDLENEAEGSDEDGWDDGELGWDREVYFDENGVMVDPSKEFGDDDYDEDEYGEDEEE